MNIADKRKKTGFSQEKIADILHVDRSTVAKWETGKSLPRGKTLIKLAVVLGCTVDELISEQDKPSQT